MTTDDSNDALRRAIRKAGVAEVARQAGISATTLYSFCEKDADKRTENLRTDTHRKVITALAELGVPFEDGTAEIVDIWSRKLDANARKEVLEFAKFKASQSD